MEIFFKIFMFLTFSFLPLEIIYYLKSNDNQPNLDVDSNQLALRQHNADNLQGRGRRKKSRSPFQQFHEYTLPRQLNDSQQA